MANEKKKKILALLMFVGLLQTGSSSDTCGYVSTGDEQHDKCGDLCVFWQFGMLPCTGEIFLKSPKPQEKLLLLFCNT